MITKIDVTFTESKSGIWSYTLNEQPGFSSPLFTNLSDAYAYESVTKGNDGTCVFHPSTKKGSKEVMMLMNPLKD